MPSLLPRAGIAFAPTVPIALNHDEAYLGNERSGIDHIGGFRHEHVLGSIEIGALIGRSITTGFLKRGSVGIFGSAPDPAEGPPGAGARLVTHGGCRDRGSGGYVSA